MPERTYHLHVFGLNLSNASARERSEVWLSRGDVERVLRSLRSAAPQLEAVVVRARNHIDAFVASPLEHDAVPVWLSQLGRVRPDLLDPARRELHYHMSGPRADRRLDQLATGRFAAGGDQQNAFRGLKASLALAARCGTLGESLDALFVRGLERAAPPPRVAAES